MIYLSAKDFIFGTSGGGVFPCCCPLGGPIGFLALPVIEGNLRPNFSCLDVDVDVVSVEVGETSSDSGLKPGGKKDEAESVSILSNKEDISNLKSDFGDELFAIFFFESSSFSC